MINYQPITHQNPTAGAPAITEVDPVRLMADAMLELAFNGQVVDRQSLALKGFTEAEIDQHGTEARDLATARQTGRAA